MSTAVRKIGTTTAKRRSPGVRAYERVRPLIEQTQADIIVTSIAVRKEYFALTTIEKAIFREQLGKSKASMVEFMQIGEEYPAKQKLILAGRPSTKPQLEDLGVSHMLEIAKTDDRLLKKASKAGVFGRPITAREIRSMRQTGILPGTAPEKKPRLTTLQKIKQEFGAASEAMHIASRHINDIRALMEDHAIVQVKGLEINKFFHELRHLCAEVAAADPEKAEEAIAILQGRK